MVCQKLFSAMLVGLIVSLCQPTESLDPGRVRGYLRVNGQDLVLTQAYAHLHDNAEKLLKRRQELRLLLVDREVALDSLAGINPWRLEQMAREDRLRGLLFKLDPDKPGLFELTLLYPPQPPGEKLFTRTITASGTNPPLVLTMDPQRLGGSFACPPLPQPLAAGQPDISCSLNFSAPVFRELPVTAVLVGREAQNSPQIQVLQARIQARQQPQGSPLAAVDLTNFLKHLQRVVVRGERATAIFAGGKWQSFIKEGETWRLDE